jgi:hypothetical protein
MSQDNPYLSHLYSDAKPLEETPIVEEVKSEGNPYVEHLGDTPQLENKKPSVALLDTNGNPVPTYSQEALINGMYGAGAGLALNSPSYAKNVISAVAPNQTIESKSTPYNERGRTVEKSIQNRRTYMDAQAEQDKILRRNTNLAKKYPGFTRQIPDYKHLQELSLLQKFKSYAPTIGSYASRMISPFSLPLTLGGGAMSGTEAMNRYDNGDNVGAAIAGLGALGAGASLIPHPATKAIGTGVALASPLALEAYDYLRKPKRE